MEEEASTVGQSEEKRHVNGMDSPSGPEAELILNDSGVSSLVLYETTWRFYLVGSNATQTVYRVLKIDRSEPRELDLSDDHVEYTEAQITNLISSLDEGNRTKHGKTGFGRRISAFALLGFVRFLEGYSMILVTKRRKVASVGYHSVYKIEDTETIPLAVDTGPLSPREQRYHKAFHSIDLSSNFYYSHTYDITHTLQHNMLITENLEKKSTGAPAWRFVWNEYLSKQVLAEVGTNWIVPVIHGYVCQSEITVFGRCVLLTVIGRRSNRFAGTRFLKRGSNSRGHVANEIEVEQIVHDTTYRNKRLTSFVQMRGSVPGFWSQEGSRMVPKPPISIDRVDPFWASASAHFTDLLGRYGAPICCLNLVKKRETKKHETLLTEELTNAISYLNQFLAEDEHIRYTGFDMSRANKRGVALDNLEIISRKLLRNVGFYCSFPELFCHLYRSDNFYGEVQRVPSEESLVQLSKNRLQRGVIRINCVDCLDRTNTAAFVVGKCVLGLQLYALALTDSPHLGFDTDAVQMLEDMFEDLGNVLAMQYGGSQLVHRVESYRQHGWGTNSKDWLRTVSRYYSNTFSDFDKQVSINLFLGVFEPPIHQGSHLWELQTDYFLHHPWIRDPAKHPRALSYTQWLTSDIARCLPVAQEDVQQSTTHYTSFDAFFSHYRGHQVDSLKEVFTFLIPSTETDYMPTSSSDPSPFTSRTRVFVPSVTAPSGDKFTDHPKPVLNSQFSEATLTTSDIDEDLVSSDEESDDEQLNRTKYPQSISSPEPAKTGFAAKFETFEEYYGQKLVEPSVKDKLLYENYANMSKNASKNSKRFGESLAYRVRSPSTHLTCTSAFKEDSVYEVALPVVSPESLRIYQDFVEKRTRNANLNTVADFDLYQKFISII
ncbi:hypothetical protein RvY_06890-2 [Ramazzottius varieornatus]|uniref:SAC domain-containing protein n=1 Tax=Ramazzottius varieornatus TaxID=947166 RepID=A0A1D1V0J3_RAMVA|nr:hypothetical protein RvY_06890-2 [Ramazzottius varieornatus]